MLIGTIIAAAIGAGGTWYAADSSAKAGKKGMQFAKDQAAEQAKVFSSLLIIGLTGLAAFSVVYAISK